MLMLKDFLDTNREQRENDTKPEIFTVTSHISKTGATRTAKFFTINNSQILHISYHIQEIMQLKGSPVDGLKLSNYVTEEDIIMNVSLRLYGNSNEIRSRRL